MRKPKAFFKIISASLALAALCACSNNNGPAVDQLNVNGEHASNWLQLHIVAYQQANGGSSDVTGSTGCSQCHGTDLSGGISRVGCFQASFNGMYCHDNGDQTLGHPATWGSDPSSRFFHASATFNGQPVRGNANLAGTCGLCHAGVPGGTTIGGAPDCTSCHKTSPAVTPSGCTSCHGYKTGAALTGPNGSTHPNAAGAHPQHLALAGVTCGTCHFGLGSGTMDHGTRPGAAFLALSSAYRAQSGSFIYTQNSCVAVSCHGGKQTPSWYGGPVASYTRQCLNCHQFLDSSAPQYNSYFSGNTDQGNLHQFHLAQVNPLAGGSATLVFCTDCHANLTAQHFGGLGTPAFEGSPQSTLIGTGSAITAYTRITDTLFNCTNACHGGIPVPWVRR